MSYEFFDHDEAPDEATAASEAADWGRAENDPHYLTDQEGRRWRRQHRRVLRKELKQEFGIRDSRHLAAHDMADLLALHRSQDVKEVIERIQ